MGPFYEMNSNPVRQQGAKNCNKCSVSKNPGYCLKCMGTQGTDITEYILLK